MGRVLQTVIGVLLLVGFCGGCGGGGGGKSEINTTPITGSPPGTLPDMNPKVKTKTN